MVSWGSVPVADPDVLRVWGAGTGLDQLLQAHQERGPLRAAVGHELDRLAPALVLEQDDRVVALPLQVEADVGADPLRGAVGHLPLDPLVRALVEHLHVESAGVTEAELDRAADDAVTHGVSGPPGGEAVSCRERVVHLLRSGGRPDAVQDVNHDLYRAGDPEVVTAPASAGAALSRGPTIRPRGWPCGRSCVRRVGPLVRSTMAEPWPRPRSAYHLPIRGPNSPTSTARSASASSATVPMPWLASRAEILGPRPTTFGQEGLPASPRSLGTCEAGSAVSPRAWFTSPCRTRSSTASRARWASQRCAAVGGRSPSPPR